PRVRLPGQVLRPLEARARDRVVAREPREPERDHQLPDRDDRPAPDEDASDGDEAEGEEREDARRRRDVAERHGERTESAERALQLLLVAEPREIRLVARRLAPSRILEINHGTPPGRNVGRFTLLRPPVSMQGRAEPGIRG